MEINKNNVRRKNPINRNNMFFSDEDFSLEVEIAQDYMEQDMNQTVVLYEVDLERTNSNDIYKEAKLSNIRFKTPVELTVRYEIEDSETKSYEKAKQKGVYVKPGRLTFTVLNSVLEEVDRDVKRGDFIGVQVTPETMLYFTVFDDGKVASYSNSQSMYGVKPFFRTIKCNYVDPVDFNG